jgi:Spy/CpxP family protein refolding chaperone
MAQAQEQAPAATQDQKPYGRKWHRRGGGDVQQRLNHMSQELNLTDDQKEKLKPVLEDEMKQIQAVRQDNSLSRDQRREKVMQIHQSTKPQIEAVLTPEQKEKLNKMHEERQQRWKERKEKSDGTQTPQ